MRSTVESVVSVAKRRGKHENASNEKIQESVRFDWQKNAIMQEMSHYDAIACL